MLESGPRRPKTPFVLFAVLAGTILLLVPLAASSNRAVLNPGAIHGIQGIQRAVPSAITPVQELESQLETQLHSWYNANAANLPPWTSANLPAIIKAWGATPSGAAGLGQLSRLEASQPATTADSASGGAGILSASTSFSANLLPTLQRTIPFGPAPASNCFGGGTCTGPQGTTDGSGKNCTISAYPATAGDFLYFAANWLGPDLMTSFSGGGSGGTILVGDAFTTEQSVVFFAVPDVVNGGPATLTLTLSTAEFGTCRVGELPAGTTVGTVGLGGSASSELNTSLTLTNAASHEPSLLMALFGSTRPSGPWQTPLPVGSWIDGGFAETGYNPGTNSELIAYNDTSSGTASFTETLENSGYDIYLTGLVVEFFLSAAAVSNCFGGGSCTASGATTDGSGTTCVISGFHETEGDFLYVAVNYLASTNSIKSVSDGGVDKFAYIGGEFATGQSVALYDVSSEAGGVVTITVTLGSAEYGTCKAGQLSAGTEVGVVGTGGTANSVTDTSLSVSNLASHEPSLLMAVFGSTRPSGPWQSPLPSGAWINGGFTETGYNPGTNSELIAYNDTSSGEATFTETLENSGYDIYLSGFAVEFYFSGQLKFMVNINYLSLLGVTYGESDNINVYIGGSFAQTLIELESVGNTYGSVLIPVVVGADFGVLSQSVVVGALVSIAVGFGIVDLNNEFNTLVADTYNANGGVNGGYLEFDTDSFEYYAPIVDYTDTVEINSYNGQSWGSFVPSVPWATFDQILGPALAGAYSAECLAWISLYGAGWVTVA